MKVTAIVPSLNPDEDLIKVVDGLIAAGFEDIVLVDDGSAPEYRQPFEKLTSYSQCEVLTHEVNKGKGRALKTAFAHIKETRKDILGVITVDGDNQHTIEGIMACVEKLKENPHSVILGARVFKDKDIPFRSRFGNNLTRAVFRFCCGIKIMDTQTGLRAIPFEYLDMFTKINGERYEYETNMLLEMKNAEIEFIDVPIPTIYIEDNKSSHFNVIRDSFKIYAIILKYVFSSLSAAVIDIVLFALFNLLVFKMFDDATRLLLATALARAISSFYNFMFNRKAVFKSDESIAKTAVKYYILCIGIMLSSYGLVFLLTQVLGIEGGLQVVVKFIVDCVLFIFSFQLQRAWVFKKKKSIA